MKVAIDVKTAALRSIWNKRDLGRVLNNERLLAYLAARQTAKRWPETYAEELSIVLGRALTPDDFTSDGMPHLRDIDLTAEAYTELIVYVGEEIKEGRLEPKSGWAERHPDIIAQLKAIAPES